MGINRLLGSEGGGILEVGDLRLRQHGGKRLDALVAEAVVAETASIGPEAC